MFLSIILIIMILAGIAGGVTNFLLPANENQDGSRIRGLNYCVLLGLGATVLVPLFLEIAQSRLMENIRLGWPSRSEQQIQDGTTSTTGKTGFQIKDYLLFTSYCFVAAAAGVRFISAVMNSVLKEAENKELKNKNKETEAEAEASKKQAEEEERLKKEAEAAAQASEEKANKLDQQNKANMKQAEAEVQEDIRADGAVEMLNAIPTIGAITVEDDPQKNRFGGLRESNNRRLDAKVSKSDFPGFFDVSVWVESVDGGPITAPVIFYLHDSFYNPVRNVKPRGANAKRVETQVTSYGAFTVGAVCDGGNTLLEFDLAEDNRFPKKFREE